jgi:hypothetical protein
MTNYLVTAQVLNRADRWRARPGGLEGMLWRDGGSGRRFWLT